MFSLNHLQILHGTKKSVNHFIFYRHSFFKLLLLKLQNIFKMAKMKNELYKEKNIKYTTKKKQRERKNLVFESYIIA